MLIRVQKLHENAVIPTAGSAGAAGYDLYAIVPGNSVTIKPSEVAMIGTGLAMEIPFGYAGLLFARSGLATKRGLRPANCVGVVDSDYRGEFKVALYNDSAEERVVHTGDRIAQLVVTPCMALEFNAVEALNDTERGDGGFGHTG